jgi:hypothetical protein
MQDIRDEVDHPVWSKLDDRFELNPLGKLVDSHKDMSKPLGAVVKGPIMSRLQHANGQEGGMVIRL